MGTHDRPEQFLLIELDRSEVGGESVEEFRVARRIGRSQVIDRVDDTDPEQFRPNTIDGYFGKGRVGLADHPIDERIAGIVTFFDFSSCAAKRGGWEWLARQRVLHDSTLSDQDNLFAAGDRR